MSFSLEKIASFGLIPAIMVWELFISGCRTYHVAPAEVDTSAGFSLYAGDPKFSGVSRAQAGERLACSDAQFGEFICMRADEFIRLVEYLRTAPGAP